MTPQGASTLRSDIACEISQAQNWFKELGLSSYVAVDLETTGLDPESEQIIEIGAVRFRDGISTERYRTFLRSERPLSPFISTLTGIKDSDLKDAPRFRDVAKEFFEFLGDDPLVGHNVDFDLGFLSAAGSTVASDFSGNPFQFQRRFVLDTAMLSKVFWSELAHFSLSALAKSFDVALTEKHRAEYDAETTGSVLCKIVGRLHTRVWKELADDLFRLIGSTTNRSRFFFTALLDLAHDLKKPEVKVNTEEYKNTVETEDTNLADLFGEGGAFEKRLCFFRHRPMQLEMAEAVERALNENQILLAEAPTGTGKSLAYLVPAIQWASDNAEEGRQVIVSSNTKGLQDQLFNKDIGEINLALHAPIHAAVLKGRNNYLCKRRLRSLVRDATDRLSDLDRIKLMPLLRWSEVTATGDIAEIGGFNEKQFPFLWSQVASDSQACAGSACSAAKGDFHRIAQDRAAGAHIVFINHALLMADFNRFVMRPAPLRKFILDEAHHIERAVVAATTVELSATAFRNCLLRIADERVARGLLFMFSRKYESDSGEELLTVNERLVEITRSLFGISRDSFSVLAESLPLFIRESGRVAKSRFQLGDKLHARILEALNQLILQWSELSSGLKKLERLVSDLKGDEKPSSEILFEIKSVSEAAGQLGEKLVSLLEEDDPNTVRWIESGHSSHGSWCNIFAAPVSVGKDMLQGFWPHVDSVVLSSATLSAGGSFSHLKESLGIQDYDQTRLCEMTLDSPFDLKNQMRIYIPTFLPSPRADRLAHESAVTELVSRLVEDVPRGTLVLCTSLDYTEKLADALEPIARRNKRALFSQSRGGSPNDLIESFRTERNAILVGAASFWEGIDVVGDALQILVVAKLPFDVPTEPWVEARSEALQREGRDAFQEFSLPVATLRLKQGIGRLIRHQQDRGIAILADPRLMKTAFGRTIRDSLPVPANAVASLDVLICEIEEFFMRKYA